jgi:hypothetical protein
MTDVLVQITFRGLSHSDTVEASVRERLAWLQQFHDGIMACRVLVEVPHRHHRTGRSVHVRIELSFKDGEPLVVSHETPSDEPFKSNATAVIHRSFDIARRRLHDRVTTRRRDVKTHPGDGPGPVI